MERVGGLEQALGGGPLWVKRDDLSASPYGGNKPRKLEWVFGEALARGVRRVITVGGLGTNHGLATALVARRLGLSCDLVLVPQPVDERVRRRLLELAAVGARLHRASGVIDAARRLATLRVRYPRALLVPAGGTSPAGGLGPTLAGLELAAQVAAGKLPVPTRTYVALGTGGTAAGIALGFALAGLASRVIAVAVAPGPLPSSGFLRWTAGRTERLLRRHGALTSAVSRLDLELRRGQVGPGYGARSPAAERARALAGEHGLALDPTYTAKAMASLIDAERNQEQPVLFWQTYAPAPAMEVGAPSDLPGAFRRYFRGSGAG